MKKPFKETKLGKLVTEKLPQVASVVGDLLPNQGVLGIVKNAIDIATVSQEEKKEMLEAYSELELEVFKLHNSNTESARNRELVLKDSIGVWVQNISASCIIVAFIGLLFGVVFMKVEVQNKELVYTLLGMLGGIVGSIFNYWFGSSAGSSKSNDVLRDIARK
jgi:hypothetical protein